MISEYDISPLRSQSLPQFRMGYLESLQTNTTKFCTGTRQGKVTRTVIFQESVPLPSSDVQEKDKNPGAVDEVQPYCHLQYLLRELDSGPTLLATGL